MSAGESTYAEPALDHEEHIAAAEIDSEETLEDEGRFHREASVTSSSVSLSDCIYNYRQENGRTYHAYKDGKYTLPNDDIENDRLDLQHNLFLITFDDRLGNAPPNDKGAQVGRVLDVGTGTGIWACEFGDEHPEADVIGFDLSATFTTCNPPNVRFEIDDLEEPWTYGTFDYIHSRMMNGCIANWDAYARKCFDNLNPGGWVEINEIALMPKSDDGTLKEDAMIFKIAKLVREATILFGRVATDMEDIKQVLTRAGFVDVKVLKLKWPTNPWPREDRHREIGLWAHENIVTGWDGLCLATLTRAHGWTKEEVMDATTRCRQEFEDRSIHAYYPVYSAYGRKPTEAEAAADAYDAYMGCSDYEEEYP
ncbi:Secondary metabolism regulator LAE1 [Colletotrichum siamense]|uniref:Secondary metabolism regulator LAE1 n=1 Tax=Colletotrichum siamense TaxID=690259 RepID=A0A9P5BX72_COLSI|nr:Secondary metabolism regulator LAE1 [Colletotrichum siamense]KAF4852181.1 Secondary metabolism regulator LAE1 [Colletotrichum siamense]